MWARTIVSGLRGFQYRNFHTSLLLGVRISESFPSLPVVFHQYARGMQKHGSLVWKFAPDNACVEHNFWTTPYTIEYSMPNER